MSDRANVLDAAPKRHSSFFRATAAQPISFFATGEEIYGQGERSGLIYRVEFGAVRVYRLLADGRRQISAFHLAGDVFGFEAGDIHLFFAEAICPSGLKMTRTASVPGFAEEFLPFAVESMVRAQEHLLVLGRSGASERVAAFLLDMIERQGDSRHIDLAMTRSDIGDYLGLTIETVSRVLSKMKADGIIRLPSLRAVEVRCLSALRALGE